MRNFKLIGFYKVATLLAVLFIFSSSCKKDKQKDDKVNPDYVGTWTAMSSISTDYGDTSLKDLMTLTETSFTDLRQIQFMNAWLDFTSMKGTLSVNGNLININIAEAGTSFDMATGIPSGTIKTYKAGTPEFDKLLSQAKLSKTFKSEYSVAGNKLTLKTDYNEDGDYLDELETTVYTRQ